MSTVRHVRRTSHSDVTIDTESNPRFRIMTIVIRVSNSQYHDVLIYRQRCSLMMLNETKTQLTCLNRKPIQASLAAAVRSMFDLEIQPKASWNELYEGDRPQHRDHSTHSWKCVGSFTFPDRKLEN